MTRGLVSIVLVAGALAAPVHAAMTAYVANALDGTVSVVDVRTGAPLATVPVGCDPRALVAHPDGSRVYVANTCADDLDTMPGTVSVIETATASIVDTITVPFGPVALAVDAERHRLYAACLNEQPFSDEDSSGALFVADLETGAPIDQLPLFIVPRDLVLTRDGARAFVSGVAGFRDDDGVVRLNFSGVINIGLATFSPDGPTYRGAGGFIDIDASGRTLYVVDHATDELAVVDTATTAELARAPTGVAGQDVVLDRRRRRVFVSSAGDSPNALPDAVTAIDTRTNAVASTFDGGWAPVGMALVPNRGLLLVTNFYSGMVRVMRARTGKLLRTIPAGPGADAVAVVR
jgi:YVTN family beta-propeller protein